MRRTTRCVALVAGLIALAAGGCAGPGRGLLVAAEPGIGQNRTFFAVTTRSQAPEELPGYLFSGERGDTTRFASLTLSLPPGRAPGAAPADGDHPDPAKHIVLVSSHDLSRTDFGAQLKARGPSKRRALVFIHGYNTTFDAAAIRFAQIVADTKFEGLPILFSWPSRGSISDYGYDKDSANYSRDALENLLATLAREPGISGIDIFAHSMGNWVTMETLRQLAIAKDQKTLSRLDKIVLAAPDVDMDVFRTQIARLGPLASRMTIYASRDDYALRISRLLFGGKIRAGENTDLAEFRAMGLSAHDLSKVEGGVGRNHGKAFDDGATIAEIGAALNGAGEHPRGGGLIGGSLHTLGRSVSTIGEAFIPGPAHGGVRR